MRGSGTACSTDLDLDPVAEMLMSFCTQRGIREFLKVRTSYDVLPLSFRLVVLDNDLLIKKSLNILIQNGAVTRPRPGQGR
jgi:hypothetical protein